jgi:hypothetical protein
MSITYVVIITVIYIAVCIIAYRYLEKWDFCCVHRWRIMNDVYRGYEDRSLSNSTYLCLFWPLILPIAYIYKLKSCRRTIR